AVDYAFNGGALDGDGTIDLSSAVTSFSGTSGSAKISVNGGTARFDGTHTGTGKLALTSGKVAGLNSATFGSLDWSGGEINATTLIASGASITAGAGKSLTGGGK